MKKSFALVSGLLMTVASVTGCGSSKKTIRLQLTPSRPTDTLSATAAALKPLLEKEMEGYNFVITTGTDFAADGQALAAGSIDAAFITASAFAQTQIKFADKVDMLLTATRSGFQVVEDFADESGNHNSEAARALQVQAMNGTNPKTNAAYDYKGQGFGVAGYYYAEMITTKAKADELKGADGKLTLEDFAGKKIGMQGTASPAGYTYPMYEFSKVTNNGTWANGMKGVEENPDASKGQFQIVNVGNYNDTFNALMSGQIDACWGYMDFRANVDKEWKDNGKNFSDTYTVALTQGILNDGVAVRSGLDTEVREALAKAFKSIVTTGDKDTEGTGANIIYGLYQHTGYKDATNDDYAGEVEFEKWNQANKK